MKTSKAPVRPGRAAWLAWAWPSGSLLALAASALLAELPVSAPAAAPALMERVPASDAALALAAMV